MRNASRRYLLQNQSKMLSWLKKNNKVSVVNSKSIENYEKSIGNSRGEKLKIEHRKWVDSRNLILQKCYGISMFIRCGVHFINLLSVICTI